MKSSLRRGIGRVLFWRYERGSWQYDIACGVILLFIFLTPKNVFDGSFFAEGWWRHDKLETAQGGNPEPSSESSVLTKSPAPEQKASSVRSQTK